MTTVLLYFWLVSINANSSNNKDNEKQSVASELLTQLNEMFRTDYAKFKQVSLPSIGNTVFILNGSVFSMHQQEPGGQEHVVSVEIEPVVYTNIKSICHIPITIWMKTHQCFADTKDAGFETVKSLVEKLIDAETYEPNSPELRILNNSIHIIDELLITNNFPIRKELVKTYHRKSKVDIERLIITSVEAHLNSIHSALTKLMKLVIPGNQIWAVVTGEHMVENRNSNIQYLSAALGTSGEGDRVFYSTRGYKKDEIFDLIQTHIVDKFVGVELFDDENVMHSDVLGPAMETIIIRWKSKGMIPIV